MQCVVLLVMRSKPVGTDCQFIAIASSPVMVQGLKLAPTLAAQTLSTTAHRSSLAADVPQLHMDHG